MREGYFVVVTMSYKCYLEFKKGQEFYVSDITLVNSTQLRTIPPEISIVSPLRNLSTYLSIDLPTYHLK